MHYLVIILVIVCGLLGYGFESERRDHRQTTEAYAAFRANTAAAGQASEASERAKDQRWREQLDEVKRDAEKQALLDAGDRDRLRTAGVSLRQQLAAARARSCATSQAPATPGSGPAADPAPDLYADVQRRLDEAEERTVEFADAAHRAGLACQRSYDAVSQ